MRTRLLPFLLAAVLFAACTPQPPPAPSPSVRPSAPSESSERAAARRSCRIPCRARPRRSGSFERRWAPEASGLVASRRHPGLLYLLDDGPGARSVLVLRDHGRVRVASVGVEGLVSTDSEALAAGRCGNSWCIYVGDIGDNLRRRDAITITRFVEPRRLRGDEWVSADSVQLRYPDGAHNAEALLADDAGNLLIVTKAEGARGRGAARVYRTTGFADQVLRRGSKVRLPAPRFPLAAAVVGNVVTGGDSTQGRVVLRTYDALYEFTAPTSHAPLHRFPSWPVREITSPQEPQGEAVAYGSDGCGIFTVSEDSGVLTSIPCKAERLPASGDG